MKTVQSNWKLQKLFTIAIALSIFIAIKEAKNNLYHMSVMFVMLWHTNCSNQINYYCMMNCSIINISKMVLLCRTWRTLFNNNIYFISQVPVLSSTCGKHSAQPFETHWKYAVFIVYSSEFTTQHWKSLLFIIGLHNVVAFPCSWLSVYSWIYYYYYYY